MGESSVTRDPRIDRAVSWALTAVAGIAFSIGAWFFASLNATVSKLNSSTERLSVLVEVISKRLDQNSILIEGLRERVDEVRQEQAQRAADVYSIQAMREELQILRTRVKDLEQKDK